MNKVLFFLGFLFLVSVLSGCTVSTSADLKQTSEKLDFATACKDFQTSSECITSVALFNSEKSLCTNIRNLASNCDKSTTYTNFQKATCLLHIEPDVSQCTLQAEEYASGAVYKKVYDVKGSMNNCMSACELTCGEKVGMTHYSEFNSIGGICVCKCVTQGEYDAYVKEYIESAYFQKDYTINNPGPSGFLPSKENIQSLGFTVTSEKVSHSQDDRTASTQDSGVYTINVNSQSIELHIYSNVGPSLLEAGMFEDALASYQNGLRENQTLEQDIVGENSFLWYNPESQYYRLDSILTPNLYISITAGKLPYQDEYKNMLIGIATAVKQKA